MTIEWFQRKKQHGLEFNDNNKSLVFRWGAYISIIAIIWLFAGEQQEFIYFRFLVKTFLVKILIFSLVAFCVLMLLALLVKHVTNKDFYNSLVEEEVTTLIMGDSHMQTAFNPESLSKARNVASSGEHYLYSYYKLKNITDRSNKIDKVILGLGYHNFGKIYDDFLLKSELSSNMYKRFSSVLELDQSFEVLRYHPSEFMVQTGSSHGNALKAVFGKEKEIPEGWGHYRFSDNSNIQDTSLLIHRLRDHFNINGNRDGEFSATQEESLKKIIGHCLSNKIKLVLVNTPLHKSYRDSIPTQFQKRLNDFVSTLPKEVTYFDFSSIEYPDDEFGDIDHLNSIGASKFLEELQNNYSEEFN